MKKKERPHSTTKGHKWSSNCITSSLMICVRFDVIQLADDISWWGMNHQHHNLLCYSPLLTFSQPDHTSTTLVVVSAWVCLVWFVSWWWECHALPLGLMRIGPAQDHLRRVHGNALGWLKGPFAETAGARGCWCTKQRCKGADEVTSGFVRRKGEIGRRPQNCRHAHFGSQKSPGPEIPQYHDQLQWNKENLEGLLDLDWLIYNQTSLHLKFIVSGVTCCATLRGDIQLSRKFAQCIYIYIYIYIYIHIYTHICMRKFA